ncbi:phosphodiesterase [Streptomyces sp. NPDC056600]|uniref:phosphodiesterase n=1 Tax=Streptomyces sp. NPDC056600 TaxID=3345874 RepID=UPI0036AF41B1
MTGPFDRTLYAVARQVARVRAAPALHPAGVTTTGTLEIPGDPSGGWGVDWLDRPAVHPVTARWSRAAGLPGGLPDGIGLALRVDDADGAGATLDLLFTSCGPGRLGRRLPLPRRDALSGPYSTLTAYQVGGRHRLLTAHPVTPAAGRVRAPVTLAGLRKALGRNAVGFRLCAETAGEPRRMFASLTLGPAGPEPAEHTLSFEPYAHCLPGLRPTRTLRAARVAAYAGSRDGRRGRD